jgi:hypothetical protein
MSRGEYELPGKLFRISRRCLLSAGNLASLRSFKGNFAHMRGSQKMVPVAPEAKAVARRTLDERQLLRELAEEFPMLRNELRGRLEIDARYRDTERAIQIARQKRRRALGVDQVARTDRLAWLVLATFFIIALCAGSVGWFRSDFVVLLFLHGTEL